MTVRSNSLISLLVGVGLLAGSMTAAAQDVDPDWPCVQRLLPEVAGPMIWPGPPLDNGAVPKSDKSLDALAGELAARRVPVEEAELQVATFAEGLPDAEKTERLTDLFKATLNIINSDRASIISGIKRFSQGQRTLADKINAKNQEIESIDRSDYLKRDAAMAERDWDIRIFEDRRQSLTYLCEQPVLLEQRAFTLARTIASHLE